MLGTAGQEEASQMSASLSKAGLRPLIRAIPAWQEAHKILGPSLLWETTPDEEEQEQLYLQEVSVIADMIKAALFSPKQS